MKYWCNIIDNRANTSGVKKKKQIVKLWFVFQYRKSNMGEMEKRQISKTLLFAERNRKCAHPLAFTWPFGIPTLSTLPLLTFNIYIEMSSQENLVVLDFRIGG